MSGNKCKQDLNQLLPNGLRGTFSVKKITNTGRTVDCHVQSNDHLVELKIENYGPNPFAIKFQINIQDNNINFSNGNNDNIGEHVVISPAAIGCNSWDCRIPIEANAGRFSVDELKIKLDYWRMALSGSPTVEEEISVDVN
jgi:hypothetical protein